MFFLPVLRERSPSPTPPWDPSQRRQFSTTFSSVSSSHRQQQLSMNCCNVCNSSMGAIHQAQPAPAWDLTGSQVLPGNLLQCGLLSPWVCRSLPGPAPAQASHGVTASFGHPPALLWVSSRGCRWISASMWSSMGCRVTAALPWASGESQLLCLEDLLSLLSQWSWCLQSCLS